MSPEVVALLVEGAKVGLQSYFNYMRVAGKSEEEISALYEEEKRNFLENDPDKLPDVK